MYYYLTTIRAGCQQKQLGYSYLTTDLDQLLHYVSRYYIICHYNGDCTAISNLDRILWNNLLLDVRHILYFLTEEQLLSTSFCLSPNGTQRIYFYKSRWLRDLLPLSKDELVLIFRELYQDGAKDQSLLTN